MAKRPFNVPIPEQPEAINTLGRDILHQTHRQRPPTIPAATAIELEGQLDEAKAQLTLQGELDKKEEELNEEPTSSSACTNRRRPSPKAPHCST